MATLYLMPSFSRKILVPDKGVFDFHYDRIHTVSGTQYFILVNNNRVYHRFRMQQKEGLWVLVDTEKIPDWILQLEVELANAILRH
ncbi:MAG TPA: hypothetical protein VEZ55_17270 [Chitinophagaceae bacterium]|nr:hypothetical protein [Chitinophagaceae bacterium]